MSNKIKALHKAIEELRTKEEVHFSQFLKEEYLSVDLISNIERFETSNEFERTLALFDEYAPTAKKVAVFGAGNGTAAVNVARKNYEVIAVEDSLHPNLGAKALYTLKDAYKLQNFDIINSTWEKTPIPTNSVDIVYMRQNLNYADDLDKVLKEIGRILKLGGVLIATRTQVLLDDEDKDEYLQHSIFHNSDNAYSIKAYKNAIFSAGLNIWKTLKYYDSTINYLPNEKAELIEKSIKNQKTIQLIHNSLAMKVPFIKDYYAKSTLENYGLLLEEKAIYPRFYTYIAVKD